MLTNNQDPTQSLLSGQAHGLQPESWTTPNEKRVHLQLSTQNLGTKERSFERIYFVCISARRDHIALAFLRRLLPFLNSSNYGPSCNYKSQNQAVK